MLGLPNGTKIYFCSQPVDFRRGFDGLSGMVESVFEMNVLDGHLFLFVNRRRDRIKALWWEPGGLILWYKRLERGTFQLLTTTNDDEGIELDYSQLVKLLGGLDLRTGRRRRRYHRVD